MVVKKYNLAYVEFYITNVCNFDCDECNRFNNYHFSGQEYWKDVKDIYTEWSKIMSFGHIAILGGEPLLNPSINEWIDGIASLWPTTKIEIVTNGTRFLNVPNLYDVVRKYKGRVYFDVHLHNATRKNRIINDIKKLFGNECNVVNGSNDPHNNQGWNNVYNTIRDPNWPECKTPNEFKDLPTHIQEECTNVFQFNDVIFKENNTKSKKTDKITIIDKHGVSAIISISDVFSVSALKHNSGVFSLHNSDPNKAMSVCYSKTCHHFMKGKLYKCAVVGLLPEFHKQFYFDISTKDKELMHSYSPMEYNSSDSFAKKFIHNLSSNSVIPQCKFCPDNAENLTKLVSKTNNKIKVKKIPLHNQQ